MERSYRRRKRSPRVTSMVTLFPPLLLLLLVLMPVVQVDAQKCVHYKQEELLDRLDARLALCMDEQLHRVALESVKDRFATNEYDRQHPLALVAFSNSSRTLDSLAGAVASALFGEKPASRQSVQVLDFAQLIPSQLLASTNHDVKQVLRAALASSLGACPERTLFIMENVQVLDGATLPVLDTFLDPLNGKRAHFQQHQSGGSSKLLDSTQSVFLFLYKVERAAFEQTAMKMLSPSHGSEGDAASRKLSQHKAWRDFLMAKWMRKEGFTVEFTPQAFVGRLTEGVTLFASDDQDDAAVSDSSSDNSQQQQASRTWEQQCLAYRRSGSDDANETSDGELFFLQSHDDVLRVALGLIPAFMLLYCAKLWTQETAVKRAKRGSIKKNTKKAKRTGKKAKKKY